MNSVPTPGQGKMVVAVPAPGNGPHYWAGAPSAVLIEDGTFAIAYRNRYGSGRDDELVIARSPDGERFETVATLDKHRYGASMTERPALIQLPNGHWRMYVSFATPDSLHWWISLLEADSLERLVDAPQQIVFPGDSLTGVKDPVIRFDGKQWHAWICCHLLDIPGAEDRMETAYATSKDGITWSSPVIVLRGRSDKWDSRGTRLTSFLPDGRATYDGRASKEENWFERTGLALPGADGFSFIPSEEDPISIARYLDVVSLPDGGYRLYYEQVQPDESHELRTELIAPRKI